MNTFEKLTVAGVVLLFSVQVGTGAWRLWAGPAPAKKAIPREIAEPEFLWAIAMKETANRPAAIGAHGERSRYQFTRETWAQHTNAPFAQASSDEVLADIVASDHFDWLQQRLHAAGVVVTVRTMAAAWNFGPKFAKICADSAYAREVENLYEDEVRR